MKILFGSYKISIKSYKPHELKLDPIPGEDYTIVVRQKVAHLYFIPIYPIEKTFEVRKGGKFYHMPDEYDRTLRRREFPRSPFYCYTLPIILVLVLGFYSFGEKIANLFDGKARKETVRGPLDSVSTGSYLLLARSEDYDIDMADSTNVLELLAKLNDEVKYRKTVIHEVSYNVKPYMINDAFAAETSATLTMDRDDFEAGFTELKDVAKVAGMEPFGADYLGNGVKYLVKENNGLNIPVIEISNFGTIKENTVLQFDMQNLGTACELIEINILDGRMVWDSQLESDIPTNRGDITPLRVRAAYYDENEAYRHVFTFRDKKGDFYKYMLKGAGLDYTFERTR